MKNKYKAFVNSYVNFEFLNREGAAVLKIDHEHIDLFRIWMKSCLLYTSDAADE